MHSPRRQAALKAKRAMIDVLLKLERLDRFHQALVYAAQTAIFIAAVLGAFLLRFDFSIPQRYVSFLRYGVIACVLVKPIVFHYFELDRGWWRFISVHDVARLTAGNAVASAASALAILALAPHGFPRSVYIIDFVLALVGTAAIRVGTRLAVDAANASHGAGGTRTIIYGAGSAGITLARELRANQALRYTLCGFVDDHDRKRDLLLQGLRVLGNGRALPALAKAMNIDEVLIALPSATSADMNRVLACCEAASVRFRTIPALGDLVEGRALAAQIREVAVEDLLGRSPVRLELPRISEVLREGVVLITGAAGSIGSELCRQIARFRPAQIIALEIAETPLFFLQCEITHAFPDVAFSPRIGSVQNLQRLEDVFREFRPTVVYHAAAYKHVPMMESHAFEAVENNIFGTCNLARMAAHHGADKFVLISSDKAVRPANIMGATKRVAELVLGSQAAGRTKFVAVRFGNVLGSNGSVVPTFKEQIARGGPVTVTHPEMLRYFMTIPEACQLVLQSSAMGQGGEVFVLDMGDPVKIVDLARKLILLSGKRPDDDIKIEFTGIRPGEKLFEELNGSDEYTLPTFHEKIKIFSGPAPTAAAMDAYLEALRRASDERNLNAVIEALLGMVPDYTPSAQVYQSPSNVSEPSSGRAVAASQ